MSNPSSTNPDRKKIRTNELLCVPVSDMRTVLDAWATVVQKYNDKELTPAIIKQMDDALANIVQFTKRPTQKPLKF